MSESSRLRLSEVRAAFRLVGECRELGRDPDGWTGHLAAALPGLTGSQFTVAGEFTFRGDRPVPHTLAEVGWPSERDRAFFVEWTRDPGRPDHPALAAFAARPRPRGTRTRKDLVGDRDWDRNPYVNEVLRAGGVDEGMVSGVAMAGGRDHLIMLARAGGDRPFGRRERRLVGLIHGELAPHLGRSLATSADPPGRLSPRLRQVLDALLGGDPEKLIARRLGVSSGTLHGYVKQVYRAFGAGSRAELMADFLRRHRGHDA